MAFVEYQGERFYLQSSKRYYQSGRKNVEERLLHRRVWSDANGPIPDGVAIHHKDGDWRNNELLNLEPIPASEHCSMHMLERWAKEGERLKFLDGLEKAREASKSWHSSEDGVAWHRENGTRSWAGKEKVEIDCVQCGERFLGHRSAGAMLCSKSCRQKHSYKNRFTEERSCASCGKMYAGSRYKKTMYCSRGCSNRARVSGVV
jgi:hypothetical protein